METTKKKKASNGKRGKVKKATKKVQDQLVTENDDDFIDSYSYDENEGTYLKTELMGTDRLDREEEEEEHL